MGSRNTMVFPIHGNRMSLSFITVNEKLGMEESFRSTLSGEVQEKTGNREECDQKNKSQLESTLIQCWTQSRKKRARRY